MACRVGAINAVHWFGRSHLWCPVLTNADLIKTLLYCPKLQPKVVTTLYGFAFGYGLLNLFGFEYNQC
jgi:hypothetical protein